MSEPDTLLEVPESIGKYSIKRVVDSGSMGIVYEGFDPLVRRSVAIKVARNNPDIDEHMQRSFFAEAHAAGSLQHRHIVSVYDAGVEHGQNYIVMEYVEGKTLKEYTQEGQRLPIDVVVDIIFKCCKALDYGHRAGVIHRDIKPGNIMYSEDGDAKIMDFSIALMDKEQDDYVVGSPYYMSPEQADGKQLGPQSDLYSLGAVMYHLLTGRPPFKASSLNSLMYQLLNTDPTPVRDLRPEVPRALSDIVAKALAKEPADRYQSGREFAAVLSRQYHELKYAESQIDDSERRDMLASLHFFREFSDDEIDEVVHTAHWLHFNLGDVVISEGDIDNSFFIIVRGKADVTKEDVCLGVLRKGDCFGEIGFLTSQKRTASIVARSFLVVMKIGATLMDEASASCQSRYYKAFAMSLITRLADTTERIAKLKNA
ncbi:MAG: protein kinase domain-containing protein [Gammaproteobacteria bacterium]